MLGIGSNIGSSTTMTFEMRAILESKRALREQLVALPIEEKLLLLERLRERTLAIVASRPTRTG